MSIGFTQLSAPANMYLNHTQQLLEQIKQTQYIHVSLTRTFRDLMHARNNSKTHRQYQTSTLCFPLVEHHIPRSRALLRNPQMVKTE